MINEIFIISDIDTLKVISDPFRIQILDAIRFANINGENRTVKQLAEILGLPTSKLYYHISMLEKHGLIKISKTQLVSGIVEKHYRVTAYDLIIDRQLFASGLEQDEKIKAMISLVDSTLDLTRADFLGLLNSVGTEGEIPVRLNGRRGHISRNLVSMTPDQAEKFYDRLLDLLNEFNNEEVSKDDESYTFNLTAMFLPVKQDLTITNFSENIT
jgi:DNA-binding transcriptional ArsR family regulator